MDEKITNTYNQISTFKVIGDIWSGGEATLNGTTITIGTLYTLTQDSICDVNTDYCFVEGTLITLANGELKKVEDITYQDEILTYDFDNNTFSSQKPCWIAKPKTTSVYWETEFDDGTILKTVGANNKSHRIFNYTKQKFLYPQNWGNDKAFKDDKSTPTIIRCEKIKKQVNYYNFATHKNLNNFANGILCGCRFTNVYPIYDMKYVKNKIEKHTILEYPNISLRLFNGLRLYEQPTSTNKNDVKYFNTTYEHVLHNYVEHEKDYNGESDYKEWVYRKEDNK